MMTQPARMHKTRACPPDSLGSFADTSAIMESLVHPTFLKLYLGAFCHLPPAPEISPDLVTACVRSMIIPPIEEQMRILGDIQTLYASVDVEYDQTPQSIKDFVTRAVMNNDDTSAAEILAAFRQYTSIGEYIKHMLN